MKKLWWLALPIGVAALLVSFFFFTNYIGPPLHEEHPTVISTSSSLTVIEVPTPMPMPMPTPTPMLTPTPMSTPNYIPSVSASYILEAGYKVIAECNSRAGFTICK